MTATLPQECKLHGMTSLESVSIRKGPWREDQWCVYATGKIWSGERIEEIRLASRISSEQQATAWAKRKGLK